jgi:DNA-binding NtrC family response regulator
MAPTKTRLVLLTQNPSLLADLKDILEDNRRHVVEVRDVDLLNPLLERGTDLVIIDLGLPDKSLAGAATRLGQRRDLPLLALASTSSKTWNHFSPANPLEETLTPPFNAEALQHMVDRLVDKSRFLRQQLIGVSAFMQDLRERLPKIASTPITVLITGESGTGKDVVARALHKFSQRHQGPFLPINCAAIPENLLESELFGHERGAFTDAKTQRKGLFEQADGGTVFLDEIGEMTPMAQVRLLRVLEEREVTRVGGAAAIAVDVRIVAATNKNLQQAVAQREFRQDLYYRLKVVELALPPLRQRRQDIPLLVEHMARDVSREGPNNFVGFSAAAMDLLSQYQWPGNIRELRNLVKHFVFLGPDGLVQPADLLPQLESPPVAEQNYLPVATHKTPDQSERELIYFALLDLKREMAELRRWLEERLNDSPPSQPRPIFPLEQAPFDPAESDSITPRPVGQDATGAVRPLKDLEREAIEETLTQVKGNRQKAADLLGISVRTLYRKLDEYGLK